MQAVFESENPYRSVGYWDVNCVAPTFSDNRLSAKGVYLSKSIVGSLIMVPDTEHERNRFYNFFEGEKHNQITLTEPMEIYNMRKWIKYRKYDFKEVCSEGVPEDLQGYIQSLKAEEPEQEPTERKGRDTHNEDWDRVMEKRMRR